MVGQVGLVLFMFQTGYDCAARRVATGRHRGLVPAPASPGGSTFGTWLVLRTADTCRYVPDGDALPCHGAFVGVALAITAFPMMARIITERALAGTRRGALVPRLRSDRRRRRLGDLLAVVLASPSGEAGPVLVAVGGAVLFVVPALFAGRPRPQP